MSTQWLTVSEVAARLKISERTVQRRCKSGRIAARLETNDDGAAWLIDGATLPTGAAIAADTAAIVTTGDDKTFDSESARMSTHVAAPDDKVTTSDDSGFVAHLKSQNAFLRGQIEQHARAEAELRAALREALKAMPKQLAAPDTSTHAGSAQNDPQARENSETGKAAQAPEIGAQTQAGREMRPLWKVILGVR